MLPVELPLDLVVIGAGVAGITCAQQLSLAGYSVALVEKSRGVGGRMAKRRLPDASAGPTYADHGVCYLKPKDAIFTKLIQRLCERGEMAVWTEQIHELGASGEVVPPQSRSARYASSQGINALAKVLSKDLTIHYQQRAVALRTQAEGWEVETEQGLSLKAKALVIAVPTPQAIALVEPLSDLDAETLTQLKTVQFSRSIAAIAVYGSEHQATAAQLPWKGINCSGHDRLAWVGLESSKQLNPQQPVVVVHSNMAFGEAQFDVSDRQTVGQSLLEMAAAATGETWLAQPEILQVHRWGYAFSQTPLAQPYVEAKTQLPLWLAGDWCGGDRVESAFLSGLALASQINQQLKGEALPELFWQVLES